MFRTSHITLAALVLMGPACTRRAFEFQPDSRVTGADIDLTVDRPSEADVLFVIDSSGSMAQHQDNLKRNAGAFISQLALSPNKFQIAVTTTSLNDCSDVPPSPNPWDGKCGRLLSPDGTDPIIRRTDYADNAALIQRFQDIVAAVGTKGSGYEQGLKAAALAVDPELVAPGRPNAGFLRPDALLGVVILSDETDCSYPTDQQLGYSQFIPVNLPPGQSCYEFVDKLEPAKNWAQRLASPAVKGRASLVAVGAITAGVGSGKDFQPGQCLIDQGGEPSQACSCFYAQPLSFCSYTSNTSPPSGQVSSCGIEQGGGTQAAQCCVGSSCCTAMGNTRYGEFADFFGLRYKDSICRSAYDQTLRQIAEILKRDCFRLEQGAYQDNEDFVLVSRRLATETEYAPVPKAVDGLNGDGWYYVTESAGSGGDKIAEICLAGSYKRVIGDSYRIRLVTDASGLDSEVPASVAR